jgi:hypothetical protein
MPSRIRYTHTLSLRTYASTIVSSAASATMPPTTSTLPLACKLRVTCLGTPCSGSVTITGGLLGVPVTETIAFTVATAKTSTKMWDTIATVTTSGLTDAVTVTITAIDGLGQPLRWLMDSQDYPCIFNTLSGLGTTLIAKQLGLVSNEVHYVRTSAPISTNSEIVINGQTYVPTSAISSVCIPGTDDVLEFECYMTRK